MHSEGVSEREKQRADRENKKANLFWLSSAALLCQMISSWSPA